MTHLGILEVAELCARMRARSLDLFEALGEWVCDTEAGATQRLFATASHRHAWHAELWAERTPTIPSIDADELTTAYRSSVAEQPSRSAAYRTALDEMIAELDAYAVRLDPTLDPSTARTLALVGADLTDIVNRLV